MVESTPQNTSKAQTPTPTDEETRPSSATSSAVTSAEDELEMLVSRAKLREEKARHKAVWYTLIPVTVGILFLGASSYQVSHLQHKADGLKHDIANLEGKKKKLEVEKEVVQAQFLQESDDYGTAKVDYQTALQGIANSQDAREKARKALTELGVTPTTSPVPTGTGPFLVAVAADKDLASARALASKAEQLKYGKIMICQKEGWWRVIAAFPSQGDARAAVGGIRASFPIGDSAVRDMSKWCLNRRETEPGICICQN